MCRLDVQIGGNPRRTPNLTPVPLHPFPHTWERSGPVILDELGDVRRTTDIPNTHSRGSEIYLPRVHLTGGPMVTWHDTLL